MCSNAAGDTCTDAHCFPLSCFLCPSKNATHPFALLGFTLPKGLGLMPAHACLSFDVSRCYFLCAALQETP